MPPTKPTSPWKLGFGSSKSKDANKASVTANGPNIATYQRTLQAKETIPQANHISPSKLLNNSPNSQDGEAVDMPAVRQFTTKSPNVLTNMHHPHDASSREKRRLNLLNPMALLGRRRSNQNSTARQEDATLPALPDDYDPRIRGRYIHDFSSPRRPRNPPSLNVKRANEYGFDSCLETPHAHEVPLPPSATDTSFQCSPSQLQEEDQRCTSTLPSRAGLNSLQHSESAKETDAVPGLPLDVLDGDSPQVSLSMRSKASSKQSALGLPKHAPSITSRFSFDMAGGGPSAQERLLEEKHKEKEAEDRAKRIEERIKNPHIKRDSESTFDDLGEFDDFDYDAMLNEDDGGYEERIPGVNADPDEDDDRFASTMATISALDQKQPIYDENGFSATPFAILTSAQQSSNVAAAPALFSMVSPVDENDQSTLSDFSLGGMRPGSGLPKQASALASDIRDSLSSVTNGFMHSPLELSRVNTHEGNNLFAHPGYANVDRASYGITQNLANLSLQNNSASSQTGKDFAFKATGR
ncbi:hypothetical protein KEM54_003718 [Ascosphaera aggregata]|nr:hypothetical protein KEM54_003718 [Ascosphaera aggregata]